MSRVKVSPVEWRDEGPRAAYRPTVRLGGTSLAHAVQTTQLPTLVSPKRLVQMAEYKAKKRAERIANREPIVLCGYEFKGRWAGGTCARKSGHRDEHASRERLDREIEKRRAARNAA